MFSKNINKSEIPTNFNTQMLSLGRTLSHL